MSQQPSGIDLARAALAAARAAAKTRPAQPDPKKRRTNTAASRTRRAGDPIGLGGAISGMMTDRGWEPPESGGSIIDQWPTIAPELVGKVAAVRFEHDTGVLHLQPISSAYATQLRLYQRQTLVRIHDKTGNRSVRALRILAPGGGPTPEAADPQQDASAPETPVKTRETAHPGYRQALAAVLENRPERAPENPYVEEARRRQEAAARAHRLPDTADLDTYRDEQPTGPQPGSVEASRAAALAYKRQHAASQGPRRAFDVA